MRTTNSRCSSLVAAQVPFQGNNLKAVVEEGVYMVYSYATPVLFLDGEQWICNSTKYSVTTSKHLTQACKELPLQYLWSVPESIFDQRLQDYQNELRHHPLH